MSDINNHRLLEPLTYDAVIDNGVTEPLPYFKERGLFKPSLSTSLPTYIDGNARESSLIIDDIIVVAQSSAPYLLMYQSTDSGNTYEILEDLSPTDQITAPAKCVKVNSKGTGFTVVEISGNNMRVSFYKRKANKFERIYITPNYDISLNPNSTFEIDSYQNNDLEYIFIGRTSSQVNLLAFKIVNDSVTELNIPTILPDVGNNEILSLTINEQTNKLLFLYNGSNYAFAYHIDPTSDTFTNFAFTMGTESISNSTPRFIRYKNNKLAVGFDTQFPTLGLRLSSVVSTNSSMSLTIINSINSFIGGQACVGLGLSYDGKYCNLFPDEAGSARSFGFDGSVYQTLTSIDFRGLNVLCYKGDKIIISGALVFSSTYYSIIDANIAAMTLTTNMNFFNFPAQGSTGLISSLGNNSNRLIVSSSSFNIFYVYDRDNNKNYKYSTVVSASAGEIDFKISKDGTYVVCNGGTNPALFKYNGTTYAKVSATFTNPVNNLSHTDISLDNVFVVGGGRTTQIGNQTYLSLFRLASDVPTNIVTLSDSDTRVTRVKFSKTGKYLVIGLNSGLGLGTDSTVIYVKSSNTYVSLTTLVGIRSTCIEFNSDDTKLLLGNGDRSPGNINIYNVNTTTNVFTLANTINYGTTFTDLKLSPNNKYLSISKNSTVNIFRLKTDNTLVKCRTQLPVRNFAYINSEFIDDNSILFMAGLNDGPAYANGFIFENFTNTTNRLPLIKG